MINASPIINDIFLSIRHGCIANENKYKIEKVLKRKKFEIPKDIGKMLKAQDISFA